MRTSAGFLVTGLWGNTRIQSLPLRFRWRAMVTRAASICWPVIGPRERDWRPNSPKAIVLPRLALPAREPFIDLRYLVRAGARAMGRCPAFLRQAGIVSEGLVGFVFFADPALHTDLAPDGLGFGKAVIDILTQGVQRDAALALPFAAGDVGAAKAARALDLDAVDAERHRDLDGLLDRAAEGDAALELERDVLGHELGLDLGLLHFLDVEEDFLAGELAEGDLHVLHFLALLADDNAGAGGEDLDADAVAGALDEDARHRGLLELFHQCGADDLVLMEELGEILLAREPARLPVATNGEAETCRVGLLSHGSD